MKRTITLNKESNVHKIEFNSEEPYFKILSLKINNYFDGIERHFSDLKIKLSDTINEKNFSSLSSAFFSDMIFLNGNVDLKTNDFFNSIINLNDFTNFNIALYSQVDFNIEVEITYTTKNREIKLDDPYKEFKEHIDLKDNSKILFSAPFGQGKTSFLIDFFEKNDADYEVFKLFPVNYSVSSNEDIFRYIKTEVFLELLNKDITFDSNDYSLLETSFQYFRSSPTEFIKPFLTLIPKINGVIDIAKPIENLLDIGEKIIKHNKKINEGDEEKIGKYISAIKDQEGSIFEFNIYTQLIILYLKKLKEKSGKKNILLIDDLDRIDPEHLFRILNVFSAHFDSNLTAKNLTNKFGFDKIILVADIENVMHIYQHKYGKKVDFNGYINKYFSRGPFRYDNKKAIASYIDNLSIVDFSHANNELIDVQILKTILRELIACEQLTLRDLIKLNKTNDKDIWRGNYKDINNSNGQYFVFFHVIYYLTRCLECDILIDKLTFSKNNNLIGNGFNYNDYISMGLPSLVLNKEYNQKLESYSYEGLEHNNLFFEIKEYSGDDRYMFQAVNVEHIYNISTGDSRKKNFKREDFYNLLILNINKFKNLNLA